jgi:hypothetical protein
MARKFMLKLMLKLMLKWTMRMRRTTSGKNFGTWW